MLPPYPIRVQLPIAPHFPNIGTLYFDFIKDLGAVKIIALKKPGLAGLTIIFSIFEFVFFKAF